MFQTLVVNSDIWIGIDFNEPNSEVFVDHEIKTEKFKWISPFVWVQNILGRHIAIDSNIFHSLTEVFIKIQIVLRKLFLNVSFKSFETQHISFFMLTVSFFVLYLQTIISKMCIFIFHIVHGVTRTTCSNVAGIIKVEIKIALSKCPNSNVKLSTLVQKRSFNILLNNPIGELYTCF